MIQTNLYRLLVTVVAILFVDGPVAYPTIVFDNYGSNICIKETDSKLILHNADKVTGWTQQSIIKSYGNNPASAWTESYASGVAIGQSDGTEQPSTYFVINNSNAIVPLRPTDFNGTIGLVYRAENIVFHGGEGPVHGFARLNNGFTVLQNASVTWDSWVPVYGGIDLRETGTLILNSPMYLGENVTLTNGGYIVGNGYAIFMHGDLTLAATGGYRVLHIRDNLLIDGGGAVLDIGDRAQLFVDTNVSLTLRNMIIRNGPRSLATPAIKLGALTSQLTLDNVNIELGADYKFTGGSLFINDEVAITGTSAFVYNSPYRSYIAPYGTWYFDYGTTLSVAPVTFTLDRSYVLNPLHLNDFIGMSDVTSRMFLNGASLMSTTTGLRLKQGTLLIDNKVSMNSQAERQLLGLSKIVPDAPTGGFPYELSWSPDGRYIAVVNYSDADMQIFAFNGTALTQVGIIATSGDVDSLVWSPDNRFIALADYTAQVLEIYTFSGPGALSKVGSAPTTGSLNDVTWSPDCRYVAVVNDNPINTMQIFAFNGQTINLVGTVATDMAPYALDWTPDGGFIVVVNYMSNTGQIIDVADPTNPFVYLDVPTNAGPYDIKMSPDGLYAAVACYGALTLQIFSPGGEVGSPITVGNTPSGVDWSPTGRYIVVPCNFDNTLSVYRFDPGGTAQLVGVPLATGSGPFAGYWSPDGNSVAVVCSNDNLLQVFTANYGSNTTIQAWSNAINFGDAANGAMYDLNVRMLSGARVLITGQVCDDSA